MRLPKLHAMRKKAPSPMGALARGLVAGAIGAGGQSLFFKATASLMPKPTKIRAKPEAKAQKETSLETVARRTTEGLMQRGPLDVAQKKRAASAVHYLFGAAWGGLYGLLRETTRVSPLLFGAAVWMLSDNLLLPLFRVAAWPHKYKLSEHHYALHAHFAYGLSTAAAYALLRDVGPIPVAAIPAALLLQAQAWALRTPPGRLALKRQSLPRRIGATLIQKAALA